MRVWLIKEGENLPIEEGARPMRTWILARELTERDHEVVWWHSTFSHQRKRLVGTMDTDVRVNDGFVLRLTHCGAYRKNMSARRYIHHWRYAHRFAERASAAAQPDLIVTATPPIDLAHEAVCYARHRGVPTIVDVQDLWPDAFIRKVPHALRPLATMATVRDRMAANRTLRMADAIVAVSTGFLQRALRYAARERRDTDRVFRLGYVADMALGRPAGRSNGEILFTFIGSFGLSYELPLIVRVARRVWEAGRKDIRFTLAGDGQRANEVQALSAGLPNVSLPGWLDSTGIRNLLGRSSVGLVACRSDRDTVPNKPFEYISAGLPILSSLEGEMEDLISRHQLGFSYRAGDEEALYGLVLRLADDPDLRERLGENARKAYRHHFDGRRVYRDFAEHCERIGTRGSV